MRIRVTFEIDDRESDIFELADLSSVAVDAWREAICDLMLTGQVRPDRIVKFADAKGVSDGNR